MPVLAVLHRYVQSAPVDAADFSDSSVWSTAVDLVPGPEGEVTACS